MLVRERERTNMAERYLVDLGQSLGLFIICSFSVFVGLINSELKGDMEKGNM